MPSPDPNRCIVYFSMSIRKPTPLAFALAVQHPLQSESEHSSYTVASMACVPWRRWNVLSLYVLEYLFQTAMMLWAFTHDSLMVPETKANCPAHWQPLYLM